MKNKEAEALIKNAPIISNLGNDVDSNAELLTLEDAPSLEDAQVELNAYIQEGHNKSKRQVITYQQALNPESPTSKGNRNLSIDAKTNAVALKFYEEQLPDGVEAFEFKNMVKLKSKYAKILYLFFRSYRDGVDHTDYTLEHLRQLLGLEYKYPKWYDFKRYVLIPAMQEINDKSDILVIGKRDVYYEAMEGRQQKDLSPDKYAKIVVDSMESNSEALENAGNEIDVNAVPYTDNSAAFRAALTDKYSRLAAEARMHSNPEEYIYGKYYDKGSRYYETNLTDMERRIAYNYEMQMYKNGKINGINYQDSLFRGIEIDGDVVDNDRIMFKRQTVNRQISNILSGAGIGTAGIPDTCTFTVDPYSYYISVDGVDDSLKLSMEQALNQGSNGENLYKHILTCSTQDGCNSSQVSGDSKLKFQAFRQVYEYTGLKLNELEERGGTYYTKDGEDIKELVSAAVDKSGSVPGDYKAQVKQWICEMISEISKKGWNNVADMKLSIHTGI